MLFIKRVITAVILFVAVAVVLYVGASLAVGGIAGASAGNPQAAMAAGAQLAREYGLAILAGAVGVAVVVAGALTFGGAFPWCRPAESADFE